MKKSIFLLFCFIGLETSAQNSVNTAGGDATGNGGSAAFSVGQVTYTSNSSTTGKISQGVQQAYEIYSLGLNEEKQDLILSLYPNPTFDCIILDFNSTELLNYTVQLTDIQGRLLQQIQIHKNNTEINLNDLPSASYFIVLTQEKSVVKTFKVVKS